LYGERSAGETAVAAGAEAIVEAAAAKSGMDSKTAWKYLRDRRLPSEMRQKHTWRTRLDPFADTWEEIRQLLTAEPELQPKTLFEHLQRTYPARFQDGQVRTLRRRIKFWRATEGPPRAKEYLRILMLAAKRGASMVEDVIRVLLGRRDPLNADTVAHLTEQDAPSPLTTVEVAPVSLAVFDELLCGEGAAA